DHNDNEAPGNYNDNKAPCDQKAPSGHKNFKGHHKVAPITSNFVLAVCIFDELISKYH
ncbi:10034_t:CDS:1, partial [Gigaspora margarita]